MTLLLLFCFGSVEFPESLAKKFFSLNDDDDDDDNDEELKTIDSIDSRLDDDRNNEGEKEEGEDEEGGEEGGDEGEKIGVTAESDGGNAVRTTAAAAAAMAVEEEEEEEKRGENFHRTLLKFRRFFDLGCFNVLSMILNSVSCM